MEDGSHRGCRRSFLEEIAEVGLDNTTGTLTDPRRQPGGECCDIDMGSVHRGRAGLTRQSQTRRRNRLVDVTH